MFSLKMLIVGMIDTFKTRKENITRLFFGFAILALLIFLIGSFMVNLPVIFLISVYALLISNAALIFNNEILNSLALPFTFNYFFVMIYDFSQFNFFFGLFHLATVIPCFIIIFRIRVSIIIMLISSVVYTFWILTIEVYLDFSYYKCIFNICDLRLHFVILLLSGVITSILTSNHKIKTYFLNFFQSILVPKSADELDDIYKVYKNLYIGAYWPRLNFEKLKRIGISAIVNLMVEQLYDPTPYGFSYLHKGFQDETYPSHDDLKIILDFIDRHLKKGKVLVHCAMGISRSGGIIIAWLLKEHPKWTWDDALRFVNKSKMIFPAVEIKESVLDYLEEFDASYRDLK